MESTAKHGGAKRARARDRERALTPLADAAAPASTFPAGPSRPLRLIEPPRPGLRRYLGDVWRHRPAFSYFVRQWIRKRTSRTFFGVLWLLIPLVLPLVMGALVFGGILAVKTGRIPYLLYFSVAMSAWLLFSQTAYFSTRSLEITRKEIRRVYVPRLIPLTSAVTLAVIAALMYMLMAAGAAGFYVLERGEFYLELRPATLLVPCGFAMLILLAWACALGVSPLAPRARDVRRFAGYFLSFWYFLTPVIYPIDKIPSGLRFLASLNPVTAPIELVKHGLLNVGDVTSLGLATYFGALVVVGSLGLRVFLRAERRDMASY